MRANAIKTLSAAASLLLVVALAGCASALAFGRKPTGAPAHTICFLDPAAKPVAGLHCTNPDGSYFFLPYPDAANMVCRPANDDEAFVNWCLRKCK